MGKKQRCRKTAIVCFVSIILFLLLKFTDSYNVKSLTSSRLTAKVTLQPLRLVKQPISSADSDIDLTPFTTPNIASTNDKKTIWQPSLTIGLLILNFIAILWGTQHVVIKSALEEYPATSLLNFWRFILSTLLFSPALLQVLVRSCTSSMILSSCLFI